MDSLILVLFLCVFPPLLLSLFFIDKKARVYVGYILIGFYVCFMVSGINSWFLSMFSDNMQYVTTTITPITEEIFKAIPILLYAFAFNNRREKLISLAFLTGIGFAIMENMIILVNSVETVNLFWAAVRGFASACLHGVCSGMVAYGISFIRHKKKLFYAGTFALLNMAITTHAIYNCLVQSKYAYMGYILPLAIYCGLIAKNIIILKSKKRKQENDKSIVEAEN